jgi:hypothetical protein
MIRKLFWIFVLISGCGPATVEETQASGSAVVSQLIEELREITSRHDLEQALPRLRRYFDRLTDLMLVLEDPSDVELSEKHHAQSELLKEELIRVYQLDGGRELIEKAQRESLKRLDAAEHRTLKRGF